MLTRFLENCASVAQLTPRQTAAAKDLLGVGGFSSHGLEGICVHFLRYLFVNIRLAPDLLNKSRETDDAGL